MFGKTQYQKEYRESMATHPQSKGYIRMEDNSSSSDACRRDFLTRLSFIREIADLIKKIVIRIVIMFFMIAALHLYFAFQGIWSFGFAVLTYLIFFSSVFTEAESVPIINVFVFTIMCLPGVMSPLGISRYFLTLFPFFGIIYQLLKIVRISRLATMIDVSSFIDSSFSAGPYVE